MLCVCFFCPLFTFLCLCNQFARFFFVGRLTFRVCHVHVMRCFDAFSANDKIRRSARSAHRAIHHAARRRDTISVAQHSRPTVQHIHRTHHSDAARGFADAAQWRRLPAATRQPRARQLPTFATFSIGRTKSSHTFAAVSHPREVAHFSHR